MASNHAKLRAQLLEMLLSDRALAVRGENPAAAVSASTKITELLLGRLADEGANAPPISTLVHRVVYQQVCPVCREKQPVSDTPPPPPPAEIARLRRASEWDDPADEAPVAAPPAPPAPPPPVPTPKPEATLQVPKLNGGRRRDRSNIVSGLT